MPDVDANVIKIRMFHVGKLYRKVFIQLKGLRAHLIGKVELTEFFKNASELFSDVEQGKRFIIIRHGKPIAEVSPVSVSTKSPAWKQPALRLASTGTDLSSASMEERSNEDVL